MIDWKHSYTYTHYYMTNELNKNEEIREGIWEQITQNWATTINIEVFLCFLKDDFFIYWEATLALALSALAWLLAVIYVNILAKLGEPKPVTGSHPLVAVKP